MFLKWSKGIKLLRNEPWIETLGGKREGHRIMGSSPRVFFPASILWEPPYGDGA